MRTFPTISVSVGFLPAELLNCQRTGIEQAVQVDVNGGLVRFREALCCAGIVLGPHVFGDASNGKNVVHATSKCCQRRLEPLGLRFPVCHVHLNGTSDVLAVFVQLVREPLGIPDIAIRNADFGSGKPSKTASEHAAREKHMQEWYRTLCPPAS